MAAAQVQLCLSAFPVVTTAGLWAGAAVVLAHSQQDSGLVMP